MEMSESGIQNCAVVCCDQKGIHKSQCYWGTYFLATTMMRPDMECTEDTSIPNLDNFFSLCEKPADPNLENDLYNLLKFDVDFLNASIYDRLVQRIGTGDFNCTLSHIIANKTGGIVAVCAKLFELTFPSDFSCVITRGNLANERLYCTIIECLSLPCLALTFLMYTILPELRNLHGLILRSYTASVFFHSMFDVIGNTASDEICRLISGVCMAYFGMAMLFWLNVMSFDLWWTFRSSRATSKERSRKKVTIYSIYAWGVATLLAGLYCSLALTGSMDEYVAAVSFLHGPGAITVFSNVCFFVLTAVEIARQKKAVAQHLEDNESRRHNEKKQRFKVYLKLFCIMGVARITTWIVIWFYDTLAKCTWMMYLVQALQTPAMLQGVFIFISFVCNGKIKRLLSKRAEGVGSWFRTTFSSA